LQSYIARRLLLSIPTLFIVTIITFGGLRLVVPTRVEDFILSAYGRGDPSEKQALREKLGLEGSIVSQYSEWVGLKWFTGGPKGVLQGEFGRSFYTGLSVTTEMKRRAPVSFELGLWGQLSAILISVPLGIFSAINQDKWPDYGLRSWAILLSSVPSFWIAILLITFGSVWFHWAPPINFKTLTQDPMAHFQMMLVPALIIGLTPGGGLLRLVRTQMLEVMRQDYIRTAWAKGLPQRTVLYRHALRNALIPVVTVVGIGLPNIIAGTVIFEQIFVIPGMGSYLVRAVNNLDYPVIQGLNLIFAVLLVGSVVLVDISYAILDPRIRYR